MLDASNVRVGVTGAIYVAPSGTTAPTDATTALAAAHEDLGYISDGGVTESHGTATNDIRAWQQGDMVRKVQTSHDLTYSFVMIETNDVTLREYYGNFTAGDPSAVPPTDDTAVITGDELPRRAWVLSVIDGDHVFRIVVPDGQITERGDVSYANGDPIGREVTLTCYPVDKVKATVYVAEIAAA